MSTPNNKKDNFADIRKILMKAVRNWYVFLGILLVASAIAFFVNKYTRPVYRVETKILVKSRTEANSAASFLYGSDISSSLATEGVETYVLRSFPIVKRTIQELQFTHIFSLEDEIGIKQTYGNEPAVFQIDSVIEVANYGRYFNFVVKDDDHFSIFVDDDDEWETKLHQFGETVDYNGFIFRAKKIRNYNYNAVVGKNFIFNLRHPNYVTNEYINKLQIDPGIDGSVLDIAMVGIIPRKDIDFINKLIQVYQEEELKLKNEQATKTINFITRELRRITDSLNLIENRKTSLQQQSSAQLSQSALQLYGRLDDVEIESAKYQNQLRIYNQLIATLSSSTNYDDLSGLAAIGINDSGLNGLINSLVEEQSKIDRVEQGGGQNINNPYIQQSRDNIERLKTRITESVNNLISTTKQEKYRLDSRASKIRGEIYAAPEAKQSFVNIERLNKISENLYVLYNTKRAEAEVAKASASTDLQVIDPPMVIGGAEKNDKRNYLIALFLGITLPLGFIIGKDFISNKVTTKEDIEQYTSIPILGQIWKQGKGKSMLAVYNNPKSVISESFRSVRSNLNFFTSDTDKKIFVITSSVSGEGKTFSSINLATVFAFSSKKCVLIGADLRRPKIFGDFNLKNDTGLSNYLAGSAFKSEIIQQTEVPYLDIISSGPVPPNPSELLMSKKMSELIHELEKDYDYIIIDTAPLGLVTDAFILMNYATHTIFMMRQNYTPIDAVKNVQELYESGKIKKLSILFNDVKDHSNNYGYGYGYYQD